MTKGTTKTLIISSESNKEEIHNFSVFYLNCSLNSPHVAFSGIFLTFS